MAVCFMCGKKLPSKGFVKESNGKPVHKACKARWDGHFAEFYKARKQVSR